MRIRTRHAARRNAAIAGLFSPALTGLLGVFLFDGLGDSPQAPPPLPGRESAGRFVIAVVVPLVLWLSVLALLTERGLRRTIIRTGVLSAVVLWTVLLVLVNVTILLRGLV